MRFLKFCLELELYVKIKKDLVSTHLQKPGLSRTQDIKKIKFKEVPNMEMETYAKFQQKILNSDSWGLSNFSDM